MRSLVSNTEWRSAITPTAGAAGTDDIEGSVLDMQNWNGVVAVLRMGAITGSAVTSVKWQQGAESDGSDMADLEGTGITIADSDDDEIFLLELTNPQERYVQLYVDRGTQNAVVAGAEYCTFRGRTGPITQPTGTTAETHNAPAEGTA